MKKRGVTENDVKLALKNQIGSPYPGDLGKVRLNGKASNGRILSVGCPANSDEVVIVTVYWQPDRTTRKSL